MMGKKDITKHFSEQYPEINAALINLKQKCEKGKFLDPQSAMLVKLAMAAGAGLENTVKAHTAKALKLGISEEQIEEAILINLSSIGYAKTVVVLNWIHHVTGKPMFT